MAWVHEVEIPFRGPSLFNIHALADWQLGSSACDKTVIRRKVREIVTDPNAYWTFLGDIEDDDRPSTRVLKRSALAGREEALNNAARDHLAWIDRDVLPILEPLTQKPCLGVLAGHHWTQITPDLNSVQYICNRLGAIGENPVPYLGQMSSWVRVTFVNKNRGHRESITRLIHIQHGVGGGQAVGGSLRKLDVLSHRLQADAYIRAHSCALEAMKYDIIKPKEMRGREPELEHRTVPLLNVGAATRAYNITRGDPSYTEAGMMRPLTMGWGILKARLRYGTGSKTNRSRMRVEWNIEI